MLSEDIETLVLNCVALAFVDEFDEVLFKVAMVEIQTFF